MASSQSLKTVNRATLFYHKYRYSALLHLAGASRTAYATDHSVFLTIVDSLRAQSHFIEKLDTDKIKKYLSWRDLNEEKIFVCLSGNKVRAYSNDLAVLRLLEDIDAVEFAEAVATLPVDEIQLADPKHKYRAYFKENIEKTVLVPSLPEFVKRYKDTSDQIYMSGALARWCMPYSAFWRKRVTTSYYYVEFDNDSTLSLLGLMFNGVIRKVFKLTKRS